MWMSMKLDVNTKVSYSKSGNWYQSFNIKTPAAQLNHLSDKIYHHLMTRCPPSRLPRSLPWWARGVTFAPTIWEMAVNNAVATVMRRESLHLKLRLQVEVSRLGVSKLFSRFGLIYRANPGNQLEIWGPWEKSAPYEYPRPGYRNNKQPNPRNKT